MHLLLILTSILPASSQVPSSPQIQSPAFWEHWGDGRAEIAGYKLEFDRLVFQIKPLTDRLLFGLF